MVGAILALRLFKNREIYISLNEVIPQSRIISHEEGIIEYKEVQYILGTNNLKKRKYLIESLNLLDLESSCIVDLRFNTQIIIRKGPGKNKSGSKNMQSRRR